MDKASQLTVIARVEAKEEYIEEVKAALLKPIAKTLTQEGCINYDLHQDLEDKKVFIFYENWQSAEHLKKHSENDHIKLLKSEIDGKLNSFTLQKLQKF